MEWAVCCGTGWSMPRHSLRYPGDQALVVDLARHRPKHIWQDIQCTIDKVGIIWNGYSVCLTRWALYGVIWMMGNIIDGQVGANCEGAWHNKWGGYYIEYMAGIILNCNNEFFFYFLFFPATCFTWHLPPVSLSSSVALAGSSLAAGTRWREQETSSPRCSA